MKTTLTCFFALFVPIFGFAGGAKEQWILEKSEITYTVTHPLHVVRGKSLSAKGRGLCDGRHCEFLVAVPVKTFDSGDNNRDLHMLQVTKAGLYPMIEVNAETGEIQEGQKPQTILSDLEITFAGKKVNYPKTSMNVLEWKSGEVNLEGEIILSLKAFDITPPSLLTMPVQDAVPVKLEMTWKKVDTK